MQPNPRHREEPQNTNIHQTLRKQIQCKATSSLFLVNMIDCNTSKNTMYCITKQGPNTEPMDTLIQPRNQQVSKEGAHELEFADVAVMQI